MFARGLKAKIALNIAILLLVAMLLIVLVTMVTVKRELIRSEIYRANILLASLEENLLSGMASSDLIPEWFIAKMIDDSQISNALVLGSKGEQCYLGKKSEASIEELVGFTQKAIAAGEKKIQFYGTSWSIFWNQKARMILSAPLKKTVCLSGESALCCRWIGFTIPLDGPSVFCLYIYSSI